MKIHKANLLAWLLIASVPAAIAGSKYSGIYDLKAGGRVLLSITNGGHVLSLSNDTNIKSELNPSVSTVNSSGKLIGRSDSNLSVVGKIDANFKLTGTAKLGTKTILISGIRTLD